MLLEAVKRRHQKILQAVRREMKSRPREARTEELRAGIHWKQMAFRCVGCGMVLLVGWLPASCPKCGAIQVKE